jgi:alpha-mannosidase
MVFRDEPTNLRVLDDEGRDVPFVVTQRRGSHLRTEGKMATAHLMWLASDVPAFGYRLYGVEPTDGKLQAVPVRGNDMAAENERFRVTVNPETGDLASILDRATGEEFLSGPGNEIVARHEENPSLEGMVRLTGEEDRTSHPLGGSSAVQITSERSPLYERVRTTVTFLGCSVTREVTLYRAVWQIHFRTTFDDFRGGDVLVSVRFPVALSEAGRTLVYETPYAMTKRDAGEYHCAQTVVDLSDGKRGLALINTGNAGYWPVDGALDLILFRSVNDFPDYYAPLANEHGTHVLKYAVVPHRGDWHEGGVPGEGHAVNRHFAAFLADRHLGEWGSRRSFVEVSPANVEVSAIKRAEGTDGIIIRAYETDGRNTDVTLRVGFPVSRAWKATMEEKPLEALTVREGVVALSLRGHEIATVLVGVSERS